MNKDMIESAFFLILHLKNMTIKEVAEELKLATSPVFAHIKSLRM